MVQNILNENECFCEITSCCGKVCYEIGGNFFSMQKYNKEEAIAISKTLFNCQGCVDCENCINCQSCINCRNCESCNCCNDCQDCKSCNCCNDCQYCENCIYINYQQDDIIFR